MRRKDVEGLTFLETEQERPFVSVLRPSRLQNIISDLASARITEHDPLVPSEWLSSVYKKGWQAEEDSEAGLGDLNKEELEGSSMRCGRKLDKDGEYCWRWTGSNLAFDPLATYTTQHITVRCNTMNQPHGDLSVYNQEHSIWIMTGLLILLENEYVVEQLTIKYLHLKRTRNIQ